jgi:DNA primase
LKKFQIGYIPATIDYFLNDRIIFPIYDASMNLVAISTRAISEKTDLPVYWHEMYEKSWYLYGLPYAKEAMRKTGEVLVVEGNIDVVQIHNHDLENCVGLLCTKLGDAQLATIYRYCDKIRLLLDYDVMNPGDPPAKVLAGQKGVESILKNYGKAALHHWKEDGAKHKIYPSFFPASNKKMDPDEFVRKNGIEELRKLVFVEH